MKEFVQKYIQKFKNLDRTRQFFIYGIILLIFVFCIYKIGFYFGEVEGISEKEQITLEEARIIHKENTKEAVDFTLFWRVWNLLKEKHVDAEEINADELLYGAIRGMLFATEDPYTSFLDPEENKQLSEELSGSFEGIGAEIGMRDDIITVVSPLEGMPAQKAGLRAGDKVLKINGEDTHGMSLEAAVSKMRGPKGTELTLTIFRNDSVNETKEINIIRDAIEIKSVQWEMKDGKIAHIQILRFGEDTSKEFARALREAGYQGMKGIALDLRNNPGGFLNIAEEIGEELLAQGEVIVIEEDHEGNQKKLRANEKDLGLEKIPVIVLINEGSASASEILAGALRDNRNVEIVGKQSFGKGSVQELVSLPDGASVKITIAKWLTPNGTQISGEGLTPDHEIEITEEDYENDLDPQLDFTLDKLRN